MTEIPKVPFGGDMAPEFLGYINPAIAEDIIRGGNPVSLREETKKASIKRTHTDAKNAYIQP
ncbi:MAG: hypothetical protein ACI4PH_05150 [Faecousia sp.]